MAQFASAKFHLPPDSVVSPSFGETEAPARVRGRTTTDLQIDTNDSNDIVFVAGRLQLVTGPPATAQRIGIALRHFQGEWFLDQNAGTDHFGKILGKSSELTRRAELRRRLLSVPGVAEIQAIALRVEPSTRALMGTVQVLDVTGVVVEASVSS